MIAHPIYPTVCFLVIPLVLSSIRSHIRSRNIAVVSLILWVAVLVFIRGVNAILWYGNADIRYLVWCDITTKITVGWTIAIPLTMLCLLKHLENIASNRKIVLTERDKRRRIIFELVMCYIVPMLYMALHYCFQGHRFDIFEDFGCYSNTYATVPTFVFVFIPPFLVSVISMIYAIMALVHIFRRRRIFTTLLQSSNSAMSQSHYFRLMSLALVECIWDTGLNVWIVAANAQYGFRPWISWANVHSNFSYIDSIPWILLPEATVKQTVFQWWIPPISAFGVFFFFAFGEEARADYADAWRFVKVKVFRRKDAMADQDSELPMYIDSPLQVTKIKGGKTSSSSGDDAPWEKIKLDISQTQSFSSSNNNDDAYSPTPVSGSSPYLPQKEKKVVLAAQESV